jgi:hypothetical protein
MAKDSVTIFMVYSLLLLINKMWLREELVNSTSICRVFHNVTFLVRKIFTFYINDVLLFKCPVPGPKG